MLGESGFKKASKRKEDHYPDSAEHYIQTTVKKILAIALPIHAQAYEQVIALLYEYIQSHAKKTKQSA